MDVIIDGVTYAPVPDVPADAGLIAALEVRFDSDAGSNRTIRDYRQSGGARRSFIAARPFARRVVRQR